MKMAAESYAMGMKGTESMLRDTPTPMASMLVDTAARSTFHIPDRLRTRSSRKESITMEPPTYPRRRNPIRCAAFSTYPTKSPPRAHPSRKNDVWTNANDRATADAFLKEMFPTVVPEHMLTAKQSAHTPNASTKAPRRVPSISLRFERDPARYGTPQGQGIRIFNVISEAQATCQGTDAHPERRYPAVDVE